MNNTIITRATEKDIPLLLQFIKDIADYEKLPHEVTATEQQLRDSVFSASSNIEVYFALQNGEAVAYAVIFYNFSSFLGKQGMYLEDLFVKPEHRGTGLGKYLLRFLARRAVEKNCGRMEWSVLDWNEPAIGFYKRIGAVPMDEWTVFRLTEKALHTFAESTD